MMDIAEPVEKQRYERPELKSHGTFESMTQMSFLDFDRPEASRHRFRVREHPRHDWWHHGGGCFS
jgi:hypothetical protein